MAYDPRKHELEERVMSLQREINELITERDRYRILAHERHEVIMRLLSDQATSATARKGEYLC
jgi:hypothetical protein